MDSNSEKNEGDSLFASSLAIPTNEINFLGKKTNSNSSNSKSTDNKYLIKHKKLKSISFKKSIENSSINHFNINSFFIYDIDEIHQFFTKIKDKNLIKVNSQEINFLKMKINEN